MEILAKSVGRRKEAVAQVQLLRGTGQFQINEKSAEIYLQNNTFSLLKINSPFEALALNFSTQTINRTSGPGIQKNPDSSIEQELKTSIVRTLQSSKGLLDFIDIIVKVKGGGLIGQAEAIKLAVARALCKIDHFSISKETSFEKNEPSIEISSNQTKFGGKSPIVAPLTGTAQSSKEDLDLVNKKEIRKILKLKGYLTQDARVKERRKYGLKKARKAPQYSKR